MDQQRLCLNFQKLQLKFTSKHETYGSLKLNFPRTKTNNNNTRRNVDGLAKLASTELDDIARRLPIYKSKETF